MLSRALSLATVTLLVGCLTAGALLAVENLEAGKTPSQIFSGTCNACHKSPRGLLKTVPASSLPGFLRQHYTTSSDMASVLSSYLVSNGATDTRFQSKDQPKTDAAKGAKQEAARPDQLDRFGRRQNPGAAQEPRPDADGIAPQGEGGRPGRDGKRRPGQTPDTSKMGAKQKLGKRGKPAAEEPPKTDEAAKEDSAKTAKVDGSEKPEAAKPAGEGKSDASKSDAAKPDTAKSDAAKSETAKPDATKPETGKSETAKVDAVRETGGSEPTPLRPDPVPPVTPAPPASASPAPATSASGTPEPAAIPSPAAPAAPPAPPTPSAVTASAPPPAPVAPAGPPVPPISQ
jgi:hypothetical protein